MSASSTKALPAGLVLLLNVVIVFHLGAILLLGLASFTGPWLMSMGPSMAEGPPFATEVTLYTKPYYLEPLHLANDYHFLSNRMQLPSTYFEAVLKDKSGEVIRTIKFPDPKANFWIRHRQALLAQGLMEDLPVQPPPGEKIAPPGQTPPPVSFWDRGQEDAVFKLHTVPEHLLPRNRPQLSQPTEWAQVLAKAYKRHLRRRYGAASVELIRHSRAPLLPVYMFLTELPQGSLEEQICSFEEFRHEK
jgi:hypothetical protein